MDSDDESDLRLLAMVRAFCAKWVRQAKATNFSAVKNSKIARKLFVALLISEIIGLAVALVSLLFFRDFISGKFAVASALTLGYFALDAPFDFIFWPFICRRIYPRHWFKMYLADETYFYAIGKIIDPLALAMQNAIAAIFLLGIGFSEVWSILAAATVQIPFYVCGFTVLSAPLIMRREQSISQE